MQDKLDIIRAELVEHLKTKYPDLKAIFILCGEIIEIKSDNGDTVGGMPLLQFSNLPDGPSAAVLAEALRGRIKDLPAFQKVAEEFMMPKTGGNA